MHTEDKIDNTISWQDKGLCIKSEWNSKWIFPYEPFYRVSLDPETRWLNPSILAPCLLKHTNIDFSEGIPTIPLFFLTHDDKGKRQIFFDSAYLSGLSDMSCKGAFDPEDEEVLKTCCDNFMKTLKAGALETHLLLWKDSDSFGLAEVVTKAGSSEEEILKAAYADFDNRADKNQDWDSKNKDIVLTDDDESVKYAKKGKAKKTYVKILDNIFKPLPSFEGEIDEDFKVDPLLIRSFFSSTRMHSIIDFWSPETRSLEARELPTYAIWLKLKYLNNDLLKSLMQNTLPGKFSNELEVLNFIKDQVSVDSDNAEDWISLKPYC